jgi:hypothetical protein
VDLRRRRGLDDVRLVIALDGPYREEMEALLCGSATFTRFLGAEDLTRVYALL